MHSETMLPANSASVYPQELIDEAVFNVGLGNNGYTYVKYMEPRLVAPREKLRARA